MEKEYRVSWRSPNLSGSLDIKCEDFSQIGAVALAELFPPKECPTVITKIELIEPDKYLK